MSTVVITGATQGIGKAIAEKFLRQGFNAAVCARTTFDLEKLSADWKAQFPDASVFTMPVDVAREEQVKAFAGFVLEKFSSVDVLVNNAGAFFPGKLATEPDGHLEELMHVNLYSAYHLTRCLLPAIKKSKGGHIFNISSIAGLRAYENGGAYSITKYALLGFSDNLRMELMDDGIKVTAVMPGAVWTRSWEESGVSKERLMSVEDIADSIWAAYNLSPSANVDHIVIRPLKGDL